MSPVEQADKHDRNFVAAFTLLTANVPGGATAQFGAIPVAATGIAAAFFNAAWVVEPPDPADLREALAFLRARGVPYTVHVRSDLADVIRGARDLGLSDEGRLPCFAMARGPIPPPVDGLTIERAEGARWEPFIDATVDGFGMPRGVVEHLYPPAILDDPRIRPFVGIVDGRAVATALSVRTGDTIGVYSVATSPSARGRGFGTAMTWHLLADADPGWEVAVLQASEMGRPIYERMGFKLVREFAELVGHSPQRAE